MECRVIDRPEFMCDGVVKTYYYSFEDFENMVLDMGFLGADYIVTNNYAHLSDKLIKRFEKLLHCDIVTVTYSKRKGYKGMFFVTNSY